MSPVYPQATKAFVLARNDVARAQEINQLPKRPASVDDEVPMLQRLDHASHEVNTNEYRSPGSNRGVCSRLSMTSHIITTAGRSAVGKYFFFDLLLGEVYEVICSEAFFVLWCSHATYLYALAFR